jgi:hypothetical protein
MKDDNWNLVELAIGISFIITLFLTIAMMLLCISCYKPDYQFQLKKSRPSIHTTFQAERLSND